MTDNLFGREKVLGPPHGWRPRALSTKEKLEIVVRQKGYEPDGITRLLPMGEGVQFDHNPAIARRRWDEDAGDTIPPSCDLAYIEARNRFAHQEKTAKQDIREIKKTRRLEAGKKKPKTKWASRPFPKMNRPFGKR